jgi:hypothetical protein
MAWTQERRRREWDEVYINPLPCFPLFFRLPPHIVNIQSYTEDDIWLSCLLPKAIWRTDMWSSLSKYPTASCHELCLSLASGK